MTVIHFIILFIAFLAQYVLGYVIGYHRCEHDLMEKRIKEMEEKENEQQ